MSVQDRHALTRARLAAIVRSSADPIIGETLDGVITDWTPAAERLYGYTAQEVIGQHPSMLVPPEERATLAQDVARVRGGESIEGLEAVRWTKDGRRLDVVLTISPVYDDAGQIVTTSAIVRDISAAKAHERALAESEERFRVAFQDAAAGIAVTTPDSRILHVNRAVCATLGYSGDELLATTLQAITHPDDVTATRGLVDQALAGEITTYAQEKRYIHKDGHVIWALLNGSLVRDEAGAPRYFISHIQNIAERKVAEAEHAVTHQNTRQVLERITD
jgi:PAS domain S-box-containing protein